MNLEVLKNCALSVFLQQFSEPAVQQVYAVANAPALPAAAPIQKPDKAPATSAARSNSSDPTATDSDRKLDMDIVRKVNEAMESGAKMWMAYDGGSAPGVPRRVEIQRWVNEPLLFRALCGRSGTEKSWATRKVIDIRSEQWTIESNKSTDAPATKESADTHKSVSTPVPADTEPKAAPAPQVENA